MEKSERAFVENSKMMKYIVLSVFMVLSGILSGQMDSIAQQPGMTLAHFRLPDTEWKINTSDLPGEFALSDEQGLLTPYNHHIRPLTHQPFFCRIETAIERKSSFSPRFRLGSLDYVNWLEGKVDTRE